MQHTHFTQIATHHYIAGGLDNKKKKQIGCWTQRCYCSTNGAYNREYNMELASILVLAIIYLLHLPLTTACCVHSNVYCLINTRCIRYHTTVDPLHSTTSPLQILYHLTCGSINIPKFTTPRNPSSIGEEPVASSPRIAATSRLVSYAE